MGALTLKLYGERRKAVSLVLFFGPAMKGTKKDLLFTALK
jgi:hypothetical protein